MLCMTDTPADELDQSRAVRQYRVPMTSVGKSDMPTTKTATVPKLTTANHRRLTAITVLDSTALTNQEAAGSLHTVAVI